MITSWRIVKASHAARAFDGEGARFAGGRWNSPGMAMVYTSATASLAVLEMLVHLGRPAALASYVIISCRFEERVVERLDRFRLPKEWRSYPGPPALQRIGDEWLERSSSAILEVPSAIVEEESNYLLNTAHRDFGSIKIGTAKRFAFDRRLVES